MKKLLFITTLSIWNIIHSSNTWIGYESLEYPRTPGIQGRIDLDFISRFLPNNPIIIEAGAYDGLDTEKMARRYPKGLIYSYEPVPRQFSKAVQRCAKLNNVFLFNKALGEKRGKAHFFVSNIHNANIPDNASSSLLKPAKLFQHHHPEFNFEESIYVDVITLDDVFVENNIDHVDLIWFDLQGMEPSVFRASPECLKKISVIMTEVSLVQLYEESELYLSYKQWLESNGFKVVREDLPYCDGGNVLFVRERY